MLNNLDELNHWLAQLSMETVVLEVFMMSLRVFLICFLDSLLLVISKSSTSNSTVLDSALPLLERAATAIMAMRKTDP
jgi:hypothetical protein